MATRAWAQLKSASSADSGKAAGEVVAAQQLALPVNKVLARASLAGDPLAASCRPPIGHGDAAAPRLSRS